MGLSLQAFPRSPRPRVRGFHPGPAAGLPNGRVPQATRALGLDPRGDGPSVLGAPPEPPALPPSSFSEVTPRAPRPRPQPRARLAGPGCCVLWANPRGPCALGGGFPASLLVLAAGGPRLWVEAGWWSGKGRSPPAGGKSSGSTSFTVFPAQA